MKKLGVQLVCLVCVFMLSVSSALAAAPTVSSLLPCDVERGNHEPIFQIQFQGSSYDWRIERIADGVTAPATDAKGSSQQLGGSNLTGDTTIDWDYFNYGDYTAYDGGVDHQLVVTVDGKPTTIIGFYVNYFANHSFDRVSLESWQELEDGTLIPTDPVDPSDPVAPVIPKATYYPHNTVCSFGPHFRDVTPSLTDDWYMFTALDLSQNGVQTYEMVAGNVFIVGTVTITVDGDEVTVHYEYVNDKIMEEDSFFTFFNDYDSITTVNPNELATWEYDKTYSIANDLGGDTSVLLFTCNEVTFRDDNPGIVRFWENIEWRKALRDQMLTMIGK